MNQTIVDDITVSGPEDKRYLNKLRNESEVLELASFLRDNGMSVREAEAIATAKMDYNDTFGEEQELHNLRRLLEIKGSTLRTHVNNARETLEEAINITYTFRETIPHRIIGHFSFSSHIDSPVETVYCTVARKYKKNGYDLSSAEEYVIYLSEYETVGWNQQEYLGEKVRRVTGRTRVLDELNRLLTEYKSNTNPIHIIGEMMYALNIPNGSLDPTNEYSLDITLVNPLCEPDGPPEGYDVPPSVFGSHSRLLYRFE